MPEEWILGVVTEFYRGEKHISVRYPTYRLYVHLWCDLFLIRAAILRIKNKLQRIKKCQDCSIEIIYVKLDFLYKG